MLCEREREKEGNFLTFFVYLTISSALFMCVDLCTKLTFTPFNNMWNKMGQWASCGQCETFFLNVERKWNVQWVINLGGKSFFPCREAILETRRKNDKMKKRSYLPVVRVNPIASKLLGHNFLLHFLPLFCHINNKV